MDAMEERIVFPLLRIEPRPSLHRLSDPGSYADKGMVLSDMSKPALIFFFSTGRVHTTKSTVKILAANTH
jgi:hypothetical protein